MLLKRCCILLLATLLVVNACAAKSKGKTYIILMRHAEKETTSTDPPLSAAGKKRAAQLPVVLKSFRPDAFYSTATRRTRQTLEPWANNVGKKLQTYDAAQQQELAERLKHLYGQTIVVVGHSNTIPQLANLITGVNTYRDLPDSEYGQVWIITMEHGKATTVVRKF